jgi:hypothetical protein
VNEVLRYSWVLLETSLLLIYFITLTVDKDTNGDTGSRYIWLDKSPEFSYEELANATDNFSLAKKIGQGGFGEVYYGELRGQVCNRSIVSFALQSVVIVWHALRDEVHIPSEAVLNLLLIPP